MTETLIEVEAEAALLTLGNAVDWQQGNFGEKGESWSGLSGDEQRRLFSFHVLYINRVDPGCDETGTPFRWIVGVTLFQTFASIEAVPPDVYPPASCRTASWDWEFPVRTLWEGRAICERAAIADDTTEVDAREARRYPLHWLPWGFVMGSAEEPGEDCALLRRRGRQIGYFRVSRHASALLGDLLPLRCSNDSAGDPQHFHACYEADGEAREWCKQYLGRLGEHHCRASGVSPFRYEAEAEAKAACERYYATGNWE